MRLTILNRPLPSLTGWTINVGIFFLGATVTEELTTYDVAKGRRVVATGMANLLFFFGGEILCCVEFDIGFEGFVYQTEFVEGTFT